MDGKNLCVALGALAVTFAALGAGNRWTVEPTTCHWIGAVEHRTKVGGVNAEFNGLSAAAWTNENNWAEGVVPGAFEVAQGDGTIVTNGSLNCTAVFDGDCDIHCVETLGLVSISNILVTGSTAPHFLFGLSCLSIFPMSAFSFPYIAILLYFGANTMWYWHLHLLCDKLCMSVILTHLLCILITVGEPVLIILGGAFYLKIITLTSIAGGFLK